jgi:hypothetical protein
MSLGFQNITNDQLLLINILNTMYNDNNRQIQQLMNNNNDIRNSITRMLFREQNRINTNRRNYRRNDNNIYSNNQPVDQLFSQIISFYLDPSGNHIEDVSGNINTNNIRTNIDNTRFGTNLYDIRNIQVQPINEIFESFLTPIEVFPTITQIENATRVVRFSDIVRPNNNRCPISLEPFRDSDYVTVIRFCNHIFNSRELSSWFQRNCRCPVCRYDIRSYNPNSNNTENVDSFPTENTANYQGQPETTNSSRDTHTNISNNTTDHTHTPVNTDSLNRRINNTARPNRQQPIINNLNSNPIISTLTTYAASVLNDIINEPTTNSLNDISYFNNNDLVNILTRLDASGNQF